MKIYIAGKITGDPEYRKKFADAELRVRGHGENVVLNPAVLPEGLDGEDYMRICLSMLDSADAIYMLRDWPHSEGATIELYYARYAGKKIMYETKPRTLRFSEQSI